MSLCALVCLTATILMHPTNVSEYFSAAVASYEALNHVIHNVLHIAHLRASLLFLYQLVMPIFVPMKPVLPFVEIQVMALTQIEQRDAENTSFVRRIA